MEGIQCGGSEMCIRCARVANCLETIGNELKWNFEDVERKLVGT
jgi:hypothetical protein